MKVIYTGSADFQIFDANDFKKAGIEDGKKVTFAQGEPTEVPDAVGEALVSSDGLFGGYSFKVAEEDSAPADDSPSGGVEGDNLDTDPPKIGRTGKGTSTRG